MNWVYMNKWITNGLNDVYNQSKESNGQRMELCGVSISEKLANCILG